MPSKYKVDAVSSTTGQAVHYWPPTLDDAKDRAAGLERAGYREVKVSPCKAAPKAD